MRKRTNQRNRNKGFSLVELIVVIAIMAVLVGVLAPQFIGYVAKSRQATDVQNAQTLATEIGVKIANVEAGDDETGFTKPAANTWTEVTTSVVSSVPVVKNSSVGAGAKFFYLLDSNDIVHIAVGVDKSQLGTPTPGTEFKPKGQLYPTFGNDTVGGSNWYNKIKE